MKSENNTNADFCVYCGKPVPEGCLIRPSCEINTKPIASSTQAKFVKKLKKLFDF